MFIVAVLNPKGGVGKSTVTCTLARCFQKRNNRVVIADSDAGKTKTLYQWSLIGDKTQKPDVVEVDDAAAISTLKGLKDKLDYVFIDGSACNTSVDQCAIRSADLVLIPVKPSSADAWGCHELVSTIKQWQKVTGGIPKAYCLVTQQIKHTNVSKSIGLIIKDEYDLPILETRLSHSVAFMEALSHGSTIIDSIPSGKLAAEINALADEVTTILNRETTYD